MEPIPALKFQTPADTHYRRATVVRQHNVSTARTFVPAVRVCRKKSRVVCKSVSGSNSEQAQCRATHFRALGWPCADSLQGIKDTPDAPLAHFILGLVIKRSDWRSIPGCCRRTYRFNADQNGLLSFRHLLFHVYCHIASTRYLFLFMVFSFVSYMVKCISTWSFFKFFIM